MAKQEHILIADDDAVIREGLRRVLSMEGYRVETQPNGRLAMDRLQETSFDLLITDNTMPHMTGLQLVEKALTFRPDLPVLMVSGIGESMSVEELKKRGVGRLLPKPYEAADLRSTVREMLAAAAAG